MYCTYVTADVGVGVGVDKGEKGRGKKGMASDRTKGLGGKKRPPSLGWSMKRPEAMPAQGRTMIDAVVIDAMAIETHTDGRQSPPR